MGNTQFFKYAEDLTKALKQTVYQNGHKLDGILQAFSDELFTGTIFTMGNGGSGSTAQHFVNGLVKQNQLKAMCLNDNIATWSAYCNDDCYENAFKDVLEVFVRKGDIVIGFSGSGRSQNVIKALKWANPLTKTIAFTGDIWGDNNLAKKIADISIVVSSKNMQIIEDIHLILTHMLCNSFELHLLRKKENEANL